MTTPPPPRENLDAATDRIMKQAAERPAEPAATPAAGYTTRKETPAMISQQQVEQRVAALEAQGVTQVTLEEFKRMSDSERVAARKAGRLERVLSTPQPSGGYRNHAS